MEQEIDTIIANMKDSVIQEVVKKVLESVKERFYLYPAATRNHHNFVGGLAYHTICMARMAKPVVEQYPFLDEDLVLAGILLHDVGKVDELSAPMLPEYTNVGNLLGHISIMSNRIDRIATSLGYEDDERVILLKHLVLSHHGKLEYGSPVLPMIPEAEVLTILDNLDSRMYMMKQSIDASQPGTFGPRIYALDNRMIYHRKKEEQE